MVKYKSQKDPVYRRLMNSREWRSLRASVLRESPICRRCWDLEKKVTPASEVHHIKPIESETTAEMKEYRAFDKSNLVCLCHNCHVAIHKKLGSHKKENVLQNKKRKQEDFFEKFFSS